MLTIIIQIVIFQCCFLAVYELLLRKETFFTYNRFYLILTAILSVILPFLKITVFADMVPQQFVESLPTILIGNVSDTPQLNSNESFSIWKQLLTLENIWYIGIIVSTLLLLLKCYKLFQLKQCNQKTKMGNYTLVSIQKTDDAFSFFNTIYLGSNLNEQERATIFSHEKIHAKQMHSLDLLAFELFKIIFWFNPLVYWFQNRITEVHEFIVDKKVAHTEQHYYQSLLAKTFGVHQFSIVNQFYSSTLIKKRIIMLTKQQSKTKQLVKYFSIIPLVIGMLIIASCSTATKESIEDTKVVNTQNQEIHYNSKEEVPFTALDKSPAYPGCDETGTPEEIKKCFSKSITNFMDQNFNTKVPGTEKLTGRQKILVKFKIDTEGNIADVKSRAPHPALQAEAERVIQSLPKMKAGEYKGEVVNVIYSLPIIFNLN